MKKQKKKFLKTIIQRHIDAFERNGIEPNGHYKEDIILQSNKDGLQMCHNSAIQIIRLLSKKRLTEDEVLWLKVSLIVFSTMMFSLKKITLEEMEQLVSPE